MCVELKAGDVFCTRGTSFIARMIRICQRAPKEEQSVVNHCGIIVGSGTIDTAPMVEADIRVSMRTIRQEYGGKRDKVAIYRPVGLSEETLKKIAEEARSMVGRKYGFFEIPLHAMDWVISHITGRERVICRRLAREDRTVICSGLVAKCYADSAGWLFCGRKPNVTEPDDIWDDWTNPRRGHPCRWVCVYPLQRV